MKNSKLKFIVWMLSLATVVFFIILAFTGCADSSGYGTGTETDITAQKKVADSLASAQSTPTDINYSLERYNLIRRAYWVNGQREKANALVCAVEKPLGYIVLFTDNGAVIGSFIVDGKVSSLNSYLTPGASDSTYGSSAGGYTTVTTEMADVDGSYGENDAGIFFFTPNGQYIEWTGTYLYSDIPFTVDDPIVHYEVSSNG
jgi:hypothetical protein